MSLSISCRTSASLTQSLPAKIKKQIRKHLEGTYNRRRSTMYSDVDGFRSALTDRAVNLLPPEEVMSAYDDVPAGA